MIAYQVEIDEDAGVSITACVPSMCTEAQKRALYQLKDGLPNDMHQQFRKAVADIPDPGLDIIRTQAEEVAGEQSTNFVLYERQGDRGKLYLSGTIPRNMHTCHAGLYIKAGTVKFEYTKHKGWCLVELPRLEYAMGDFERQDEWLRYAAEATRLAEDYLEQFSALGDIKIDWVRTWG